MQMTGASGSFTSTVNSHLKAKLSQPLRQQQGFKTTRGGDMTVRSERKEGTLPMTNSATIAKESSHHESNTTTKLFEKAHASGVASAKELKVDDGHGQQMVGPPTEDQASNPPETATAVDATGDYTSTQ